MVDVEVYQIRRAGRRVSRRMFRGKLHVVREPAHECRLWNGPVLAAIMRKQKGRKVPCVLKRIWDGGADTPDVQDLI
jgi:hypothetical protein